MDLSKQEEGEGDSLLLQAETSESKHVVNATGIPKEQLTKLTKEGPLIHQKGNELNRVDTDSKPKDESNFPCQNFQGETSGGKHVEKATCIQFQNLQDKTNGRKHVEKAIDSPQEQLMKLVTKGTLVDLKLIELKRVLSDFLQESSKLVKERQLEQKIFENSEKDEKSTAEVIRSRLLKVYAECKEREKVYQEYINCVRDRLQNLDLLNISNKESAKRKLSLMEHVFNSFQEQLSVIETCMTPDYDIVCYESDDCYSVVMEECNKIEDKCSQLTSLILEE